MRIKLTLTSFDTFKEKSICTNKSLNPLDTITHSSSAVEQNLTNDLPFVKFVILNLCILWCCFETECFMYFLVFLFLSLSFTYSPLCFGAHFGHYKKFAFIAFFRLQFKSGIMMGAQRFSCMTLSICSLYDDYFKLN